MVILIILRYLPRMPFVDATGGGGKVLRVAVAVLRISKYSSAVYSVSDI